MKKAMFVSAISLLTMGSVLGESELPEGYQRVAYIESTGTQYINTKYTHAVGDRIVADIEVKPVSVQNKSWGYWFPFGTQSLKSQPDAWYLQFMPGTDESVLKSYYHCAGKISNTLDADSADPFPVGQRVTFDCQGLKAGWTYGDGKKGGITLTGATQANGVNPLLIFGHNANTTPIYFIAMRLYSFRIESADGTPQRDFVPCVNPDGEPGLYDLEGGEFYSNEGTTGERFVVSSEIGELPIGYERLESVESTGTQYINTEYTHKAGDRIVTDIEIKPVSVQNKSWSYWFPFGTLTANNNPDSWFLQFLEGTDDGVLRALYRCAGKVSETLDADAADPFPVGQRVTFDCQGLKAGWTYGDGKKGGITLTGTTQGNGVNPLFIFGNNSNKVPIYFTAMRLYSFRIESADGTPQRDFVPCRDPNGAVGLYDKIRNRFYGNSAKVGCDFIAHQQVPDGYERVAYIESTGTQYINTEIVLDAGDQIECDIDVPGFQSQTEVYAFGAGSGAVGTRYFAVKTGTVFEPVYSCGGDAQTLGGDAFRPEMRLRLSCSGAAAFWQRQDGRIGYVRDDAPSAAGTLPLYVFTRNLNGSADAGLACMRLFAFKVIANDGLVRGDFVPCRNSNGQAGLYDFVGKRFLGSAGSEDFAVPAPSELPNGYRRAEYIESTGTQYVNTEYTHKAGDRIVADIEVKPVSVQNKSWSYWFPFGTLTANNNPDSWFLQFLEGTDDGVLRALYRCAGKVSETLDADAADPFPVGQRVTFDCQGLKAGWTYGDGKKGGITLTGTTQGNGVNPLFIFGNNSNKVPIYFTAMRLYSFRIESADGMPQRDFVPCYNPDGIPGLYDKVGHRFYCNAASGDDFYAIAASSVGGLPPEYRGIRYLESTGTQYINTEYTHKAGDRIVADFEVKPVSVQNNAYGYWFPFGTVTKNNQPDNWFLQFLAGADDGVLRALYRCAGKVSETLDADAADPFPVGQRVTFDCQGLKAGWTYGDGKKGGITLTGTTQGNGVHPLLVFGYNANTVPYAFVAMRLYSFRIESANGAPQRDFVPCCHPCGWYGLYDTVNGRFYGNAALTGNFRRGPYLDPNGFMLIIR